MPTTTIGSWPNVTPDPAPPEYYFPDPNGLVMPAGKTSWALNIDQANVPADQKYEIHVEFRRNGVWEPDAGGTFQGGPIIFRNGGSTTINVLGSAIGNDQGTNVYPERYRLRVAMMQAWLFPSVSLTMT